MVKTTTIARVSLIETEAQWRAVAEDVDTVAQLAQDTRRRAGDRLLGTQADAHPPD